jgi:hypothetical protein
MNKIKILIVATHKERYYDCLINQLNKKNWNYEILGFGYKDFSFRWRLQTYINRLDLEPNQLFLLIDAFDSLCYGRPEEVYQYFIKQNCDIVFAEGAKTHGINKYIQEKLYTKCQGKQINFAMIGYANKISKIFKNALSKEFGNINEEQYQLSILCNRYPNIKIDSDHYIFHVISNDTSNIQIKNRPIYLPNGNKPCFITGPGNTQLQNFVSTCFLEPKINNNLFGWKRIKTYYSFFYIEIIIFISLFILFIILILQKVF